MKKYPTGELVHIRELLNVRRAEIQYKNQLEYPEQMKKWFSVYVEWLTDALKITDKSNETIEELIDSFKNGGFERAYKLKQVNPSGYEELTCKYVKALDEVIEELRRKL